MFFTRKKIVIGASAAAILATAFFIFVLRDNEFRAETLAGEGECVFVVHGLGRSARAMSTLATFLNESGFETINLNYPSRKFAIADLSENFLKRAISENCSAGKKINFVTHSLGGILVRDFLAKNNLPNLGRVVMFAPPNGGSELADFLQKFRLFRFIFGPALSELGTNLKSVPRNLPLPDFELGIIAGSKDGKVSLASAKLEKMSDFVEVRSSHTFIFNSKKNLELVKNFLEFGEFEKIN